MSGFPFAITPIAPGIFALRLGLAPIFMISSRFVEPSRERRGTCTAAVTEDRVEYYYKGLDDLKRKTELQFWPPPSRLGPRSRDVRLRARAQWPPVALRVGSLRGQEQAASGSSFGRAFRARRRAIRHKATGIATIESSNELFNEVCRRSTADLYMLMTRTRHGIYPYAGIPWYSTVVRPRRDHHGHAAFVARPIRRQGRTWFSRRDSGKNRRSVFRCAAWQNPA